MSRDVRQFCMDLVESWNSHDIDRILTHYSEDFILVSPMVKARMGVPDGTLRGKAEVRKWWEAGIKKFPDLSMEFIDVLEGVDSFIFVQRLSLIDTDSASHFWLAEDGLIKREEFFY